ncbi:hypothetical protein H9P43_002261 [Blastocladiella emersonii ATCC 22665]|nr:hypothetical protein H9P43_002261 [Blastocladiella emersonii ATCC 22665]
MQSVYGGPQQEPSTSAAREAAWRRDFTHVSLEIMHAIEACAPVWPSIENPDYTSVQGVYEFMDALWVALFGTASEVHPDYIARAGIEKLGDLTMMSPEAVHAIASPYLDMFRRCLPPKYHP